MAAAGDTFKLHFGGVLLRFYARYGESASGILAGRAAVGGIETVVWSEKCAQGSCDHARSAVWIKQRRGQGLPIEQEAAP